MRTSSRRLASRFTTSTHALSAAASRRSSGPYAGFSTRFLKHSSLTDLFRSVEPGNILPMMLAVAREDAALSQYLVSEVLQTSAHQFPMLQEFFPTAKRFEWKQAVAVSA